MIRADYIEVDINRLGMDTKTIEVPEGSKVSDVYAKSGITLSSTEKAWVNGEEALLSNIVEDGDTIQIVGKKEGGRK